MVQNSDAGDIPDLFLSIPQRHIGEWRHGTLLS